MAEYVKVPESVPCPNHYIHPYHFSELSLGTGSNEQQYFRALLFFNKKPDVTEHFFHEHWKSVHADLTMQTPDAGVNLVRYVLFHMEQKNREEIQPLLEASAGTMQLVEWDGCAEFHAKSADHFTAFMKSIYTSSHLVGCGKRFADVTKGYHIMCGYDNLIMGPAIPAAGAKDGILVGDPRFNYTNNDAPAIKHAENEDKVDSGVEENVAQI